MLGCSDKLTLSAINFTNKDGEIVNYHLSFPIKEDFEIPEEVIQVSIFEAHQEFSDYGFTAFKICIGKITSIEEICERQSNNIKFLNKDIIKSIKKTDDKLCYYKNDDGKYIIFAKANANDIIVKDKEQLKNVLIAISNHFESIKNAVNSIRNINDKDDYSLTNEDNELSRKRLKACVRERNRKEDRYE